MSGAAWFLWATRLLSCTKWHQIKVSIFKMQEQDDLPENALENFVQHLWRGTFVPSSFSLGWRLRDVFLLTAGLLTWRVLQMGWIYFRGSLGSLLSCPLPEEHISLLFLQLLLVTFECSVNATAALKKMNVLLSSFILLGFLWTVLL